MLSTNGNGTSLNITAPPDKRPGLRDIYELTVSNLLGRAIRYRLQHFRGGVLGRLRGSLFDLFRGIELRRLGAEKEHREKEQQYDYR
jgi:hypothetical protein